MVTFVQVTYIMATFVIISNFSVVFDPILTKLWGPNIQDQASWNPKIFLTKHYPQQQQKKTLKGLTKSELD